MTKAHFFRILFALICGIFGAGAAALMYEKRDLVFEWSWRQPKGKFQDEVEPALLAASRDFAEEKNPGEACVTRPVGRDDAFLYLALGCGKFVERSGGMSQHAEVQWVATRMRISGSSVLDMEQPVKEAYLNSVRRLFPKFVYEKIREGFSRRDLQREGLARMREKGFP